eukprot:12315265-Karenia_brevis.AAC.1
MDKGYKLMANDVKRAYFCAPATRELYIEIPEEDWEPGDEDKVGKLNLSLYGTRDAAQNWAKEVDRVFSKLGFRKGGGSPCNFYNACHDIAVTVHGDDFTSTGPGKSLEWFKGRLEEHFDIKTKVLGPETVDLKEIAILNR